MGAAIIFKGLLDKEVWKAALPICFGYLFLGSACGVFAQKVGLTVWQSGIMSILVFAGSGQFIAIAMMGSGASILSIVLTTFIVNLRHVLYSSTLATYLMRQSSRYLGVFAQGITDETFAVNLSNFSQPRWTPDRALALNIISHSAWIFSNMLGNVLGNIILVDIAVVNYTLTAMFIGLWTYHFSNKLLIMIGLFGGVLALGLSSVLPHKLHIVVATLIAATAGCVIEGGANKK